MKGYLRYLQGFRKFTMAVLFLVVAIILLVSSSIPADDWLKHVSSVMIAFMATNIGEHIIGVTKDWLEGKKIKDLKELTDNVNAK